MDGFLITIIALLFILALFMTALLLGVPIPGLSTPVSTKSNFKSIVSAQRGVGHGRGEDAALSAAEIGVRKKVSSKLTLKKRLKYAGWKMPVMLFHMAEACISLMAFGICVWKLNIAFQILSIFSGPMFMGWLLNLFVDKRHKNFDRDYAPFLLSVVSLLKTGMNTMTALEASAKGLEEGSSVRSEIEMMIERLRYGVSEDKSIGAFAEDIYHPEIELFVQALLLSRRVGGTLSDTLERLAKQVRRRQFFKASAQAAVSMQRGSIWFIVGILVALEFYLYLIYPKAVIGALKDPTGFQIWQVAILAILSGIFWVRQITKIRI